VGSSIQCCACATYPGGPVAVLLVLPVQVMGRGDASSTMLECMVLQSSSVCVCGVCCQQLANSCPALMQQRINRQRHMPSPSLSSQHQDAA
jgi:hypothetical protein